MVKISAVDLGSLRFDATGLIPAIVQDAATKQVLMLGYMNQEAIVKSADSGLVTFYSRSRSKIWLKGETSGNFLHIIEITVDCDRDALLIQVEPVGPTCHTGNISCFEGDDD